MITRAAIELGSCMISNVVGTYTIDRQLPMYWPCTDRGHFFLSWSVVVIDLLPHPRWPDQTSRMTCVVSSSWRRCNHVAAHVANLAPMLAPSVAAIVADTARNGANSISRTTAVSAARSAGGYWVYDSQRLVVAVPFPTSSACRSTYIRASACAVTVAATHWPRRCWSATRLSQLSASSDIDGRSCVSSLAAVSCCIRRECVLGGLQSSDVEFRSHEKLTLSAGSVSRKN